MVAQLYQEVFETSYDIAFRNRLPRFGTTTNCAIRGYIDPGNDRILIRRSLPTEERSLTLLHELVHSCYPEWCEDDVEACAQYTYAELSDQDRAIVDFLATDPAETAVAG